MFQSDHNSKTPKAPSVKPFRFSRGVLKVRIQVTTPVLGGKASHLKWSDRILPPIRIATVIIQILVGFHSLTGVASDLPEKQTPKDMPNRSDVSAVCTQGTNAHTEVTNE